MPFFGRNVDPVFYDCYHEECESVKLGTRFTEEMLLVGCPNGCDVPRREYGRPCPNPRCGLPQAYRCPTCTVWIDPKIAKAPVLPFVAGRSAGKSVLLAALAMELRRQSVRDPLGLTVEEKENYGKYRARVVGPLEHQGHIPGRTPVGEHSSLVIKLGGAGWSEHVARFSDIAGEVWAGYFPQGAPEQLVRWKAWQQASLLRAKTVVFLADPERDDELKLEVRHNVIQDVGDMLKAANGMSGPLATVERRFDRLEAALSSPAVRYPHRFPAPVEIDQMLNSLGFAADVVRATQSLQRSYSDRLGLRTTLDDLTSYVQFIGGVGAQHRLAVVISKADALGPTFEGYQRGLAAILQKEGLRDSRGFTPKAASGGGWRGAISRIVALGRELAPRALVDFLDGHRATITDYAFFFVSPLGGRTKPLFLGADTIAPVTASAWRDESVEPVKATAAAAPAESWEIAGQRVADASQNHRPSPVNIILPLLWVMSR